MAKGMKSLAHVPEMKSLDCDVVMPVSNSYPTLYVDSVQMPEIKEWQIGMEYEIKVRVCMKSYTIREGEEGRAHAEIEIQSYERENQKSLD